MKNLQPLPWKYEYTEGISSVHSPPDKKVLLTFTYFLWFILWKQTFFSKTEKKYIIRYIFSNCMPHFLFPWKSLLYPHLESQRTTSIGLIFWPVVCGLWPHALCPLWIERAVLNKFCRRKSWKSRRVRPPQESKTHKHKPVQNQSFSLIYLLSHFVISINSCPLFSWEQGMWVLLFSSPFPVLPGANVCRWMSVIYHWPVLWVP